MPVRDKDLEAFAGWSKGKDTVSGETSIPRGALREAKNVDLELAWASGSADQGDFVSQSGWSKPRSAGGRVCAEGARVASVRGQGRNAMGAGAIDRD